MTERNTSQILLSGHCFSGRLKLEDVGAEIAERAQEEFDMFISGVQGITPPNLSPAYAPATEDYQGEEKIK